MIKIKIRDTKFVYRIAVSLCLVVILLFGTVHSSYFSLGQVATNSVKISTSVRGDTYQDIGYSNGTHVWTGGLQKWIQASDGTYVPFIVNQNSTHLLVDSSQLPFVMNKTDCTITVFDNTKKISQNPSVLIGKQFVGIAVKNSTSWTEQSVSNIACTYSISTNSTGFYLTIQRSQANWGSLKSVYALPDNGTPEVLNWFTNNNPSWSSNYKIGFVDNYNNINVKSLAINQTQLSNFTSAQGSGWNFTSNQMTLNKLNLASNDKIFTLDPGSAFNDLSSVLVTQKINSNQLNIKFAYGKSSQVVGLGQSVFQDPTSSWINASWIRLTSTTASGTTCSSTQAGQDSTTYQWFLTPSSSVNGDCEGLAQKFSTGTITGATSVTSTVIKFDTGAVVPGGGYIADNCDFSHVTVDPFISGNYQVAYTDIMSGTAYVSNDGSCSVANRVGNTVTLGSTANTDLFSSLANGYYTVGIRDTHHNSRNSNQYGVYIANAQLQVTYSTSGGGGITSINGDTTSAQKILRQFGNTTVTNSTGQVVIGLGNNVLVKSSDITNTKTSGTFKITAQPGVAICIGTGC